MFSTFQKRISSLLVATMLFSIFMAVPVQAKGKDAAQTPTYSGEQIFAGIVFGQGDVSKYFSDIWTADKLELVNEADNQQVIESLLGDMKVIDPTFFDRFGKAVYSGNRVKIDNIFSEGGDLFKKALDMENLEIQQGDLSANCGTWVAAVLALVAAAAGEYVAVGYAVVGGTVAAVVNGVVLWTATSFWGTSQSNQLSQLEKEVFIDKVATTFAK